MIQGREADLVDDDEVVAADLFDGFADGVVGNGAVEVFDEFDGGEVADFASGFGCGAAESDEVVRFAGPGRADKAQLLAWLIQSRVIR